MGIVVRAKRVDISKGIVNCSFALDSVDDSGKVLQGLFTLESGNVLVGITEKGRLCVQGSATDLSWIEEPFAVGFTGLDGEKESIQLNADTLLQAENDTPVTPVEPDDKTSDKVGTGQVGYMILRG